MKIRPGQHLYIDLKHSGSKKNKLSDNDLVTFLCQYEMFSISEIHKITYNKVINVFSKFEVFISHRKTCQGSGIAVCVKKIIVLLQL